MSGTMATTPPPKNDDLHAAESRDPDSASRHKKIATKSVFSSSAFTASFSPKLAGTKGDDSVALSTKPAAAKAENSVDPKPSGDFTVNDNNTVDIFDDDDDDMSPPPRPVSSLRPTPLKANKKVVASSLKKKTKHHLQKVAPTKSKKNSATKKVDAEPNGFWEIESIVDVRKKGKSFQYLVKWKGEYENTWEPQKNLNSSALQEAKEMRKEYEQREGQASN